MGRSTFLFVLILQICSFCVVAEKFVSAGATGGDGSAGAPYGTIALGVTNAANGETVTVLPGNYTGTVTVSGRSNILIRSSLGSTYTILKSPINVQSGSLGISIIGFSFISLGTSPILVNGASTAYVQNCYFQGNFNSLGGGGVRVESNSNVVVEDSSFFSVGFTAVFGSSSNVTVRRCKFTNNLGDTILQGGVRSESGVLTVEDSTFTSNAGAIGFTSNKNQTISVKNTKFYNNSVTPIGFSVYCPDTTITLVQANNFFCSSPGGNLISCGGWTSNLVPVGPCNACYGEGTERDCAGVCFGGQTSNCPNATRYYYVSPDGNTTNNGLSPKSPKGTIQAGINLASSGDVVIAMRGRYVGAGNVNLNFGGKAIKLMSEFGKPEDVTVDCRQTAATSGVVINSGETIDTIIQGITFTNCSSPIVTLSAGTSAKFKNCRFRDTGSGSVGPGIKVQDAYLILEDSEVKSTFGQGAVYISRQSGVAGAVIRNSRFLNTTGTSAGGAIYVGASCSLVLENNLFLGNSAGTFNGGAVALEASSKLTLLNNSFTSNTAPVIACGNDFYTTQNNFCGPNGNNLISCGSYSPLLMTNIDVCGICGGTNATTDCSGTCWGPKVSDGSGGCCREYEKDCFGKCFGLAKYDCAGTCNGTKTLDTLNVCCETRDRDCLGFCFGGRENDTSGGCCFRGQKDCTGKCFGTKQNDCNGTCDGTQVYDNSTIQTPSHCCQRSNFDCADYCFGNHTFDGSICCLIRDLDCAGICEGGNSYDNSTIRTPNHCCNYTAKDCADICNGGHVNDNSTSRVCCHYTELDCYGICFGPTGIDRNGVCCNRTSMDCNRVCGGPSVNDSLGGCCLSTEKDCAGICHGNSTRDKNNVCCLENKIDCSNVCFGTKVTDINNVCCDVLDDCRVCNGNNSCLTSSGATTDLIQSPAGQDSSTRDVTRWIILGIVLFVVLLLLLILIIVLLVVRKSKRKSETIEMQQAQIKTVEVKSAPISVNRDASASSSSSGDETEDTTPQSSKSSSSD